MGVFRIYLNINYFQGQMSRCIEIQCNWIQSLFENNRFKQKLQEFIANSSEKPQQHCSSKIQKQIDTLSEEISQLIFRDMKCERQKGFQIVTEQISRMNQQILNMKNILFACDQKYDLETTCLNKSKLQFSSILEQDLGTDITDFKSLVQDLQEKFNQWFGAKQISKKTSSNESLNQSKISKFISKKCAQAIVQSQKKQIRLIQNSELIVQKRIDQVSKTMNNVLQMLNQANVKKLQASSLLQSKSCNPSGSQPSLQRQSSLQNLKIKNFFNFGGK